MPKVRHQDSPISRSRFLEYQELASRLRNTADTKGARTANAGSIASALGTEKTKCAIGCKPHMAKSENDWNIAFAKSTTSESTAGAGDQRSLVTGGGNAPGLRGRSGAGLGETLGAAPHAGLAQGRTSDAKPP